MVHTEATLEFLCFYCNGKTKTRSLDYVFTCKSLIIVDKARNNKILILLLLRELKVVEVCLCSLHNSMWVYIYLLILVHVRG